MGQGTQKNCLTETNLLSTHNIGFEGQIRILEHAKRSLSRALYELCNLPPYYYRFVILSTIQVTTHQHTEWQQEDHDGPISVYHSPDYTELE